MIKLTGTLSVSADKNQYILGRPRHTTRRGAPCVKLDDPTYYTTLDAAVLGAIGRVMRKGVADGSVTTLHQFVDTQRQIVQEFEQLVQPLRPPPLATGHLSTSSEDHVDA